MSPLLIAFTWISVSVVGMFFPEVLERVLDKFIIYHQTIQGVQVLAFVVCHLSIESRSTEDSLIPYSAGYSFAAWSYRIV
jgi:hypothetical protein